VLLIGLALLSSANLYRRYAGREADEVKFGTGLMSIQPQYAWYSPEPNNSTELWDEVQRTLECCGVHEPDDWKPFRPSNVPKDVLPATCCPALAVLATVDDRCHANKAFKEGCMEHYREFKQYMSLAGVFDVAYYLMLAVLALSVARSSSERSGAPANQYSRFDGSVYVRRPGPGANMPQKPPAYVVANAPPPPSYGMA
jgi:hypothetical protein